MDCNTLRNQIAAVSPVGNSKFMMVYFGKESEDLYKNAHMPMAEVEDKVQFAHISDEECAKHFEVT